MIPNSSFKAAQLAAKFFYGKPNSVDGEQDAFDGLVAWLDSVGTWWDSSLKRAHDKLLVNSRDLEAQGVIAGWSFYGRWGALACPVARMSSDWAAAVCCSVIPPVLFESLRPPWEAMVLDIPQGLGFKTEVGGKEQDLAYVKVALVHERVRAAADDRLVDGWHIQTGTKNGDESSRPLRVRADQLFAGIECADDVPEATRRTLQLIGPLMGAVCMAFANGDRLKVGARSKGSAEKRGALYPTRNEYIVGRPVSLDASAKVASYISSSERGRLKVQGVVRGHWKHQPFGPGLNERKYIHVEPYWRGPEDAPIVLRGHTLGERP